MIETWIILGASSAMGRAFARLLAEKGAYLILCARDTSDVEATATDCRARGAVGADVVRFDARDTKSFGRILKAADETEGSLNVAVFIGSMPSQAEIDEAPDLSDTTIQDSFTGPAHLLILLAPRIEARPGTVIGVGSVAGDRGRLSNYTYGAAKAGFHTYLSGLRNRLTRSGGHVVTVKPGFVDTAMTWGLPGMFLVASPDQVAADLWRAHEKRRNTIYTPWFWRWIMLIIRSIPEPIFKKLSI